MENQYMFASSNQWLKQKFSSIEAILSLSEHFQLVSSDIQITYLQKVLFKENIIDVEILQNNPSPQDIQYISNSSPDFYKKYNLFNHAFSEIISLILPIDEEDLSYTLHERIEKSLPPLSHDGNPVDSLSWLALLNTDKIPLGSTLYIFGSEEDFFSGKNVHPYLNHEWKYHKRGALCAYDPSVFTLRLNKNHQKETNKNVMSPNDLFLYVDKLINRTFYNLQKPNPDLIKAREDLMKARSYIQNLENKVSPKMILGLKQVFQEATEKCRSLLNKNNIKF
ncbi:MAG: hypothetical protein ACRC9L_07990 [Brevinema sp.]